MTAPRKPKKARRVSLKTLAPVARSKTAPATATAATGQSRHHTGVAPTLRHTRASAACTVVAQEFSIFLLMSAGVVVGSIVGAVTALCCCVCVVRRCRRRKVGHPLEDHTSRALGRKPMRSVSLSRRVLRCFLDVTFVLFAVGGCQFDDDGFGDDEPRAKNAIEMQVGRAVRAESSDSRRGRQLGSACLDVTNFAEWATPRDHDCRR